MNVEASIHADRTSGLQQEVVSRHGLESIKRVVGGDEGRQRPLRQLRNLCGQGLGVRLEVGRGKRLG